MSATRECRLCNNPLPRSASLCPHCGRPGLYANVEDAQNDAEHAELNVRYQAALADANARGAEQALNDFEAAAANSQAVMARSPGELLRLVTSDNEIYATFYQLIEGGIRTPESGQWDFKRQVADAALFPGYFRHIRFAALSLDGIGLSTFGSCSIGLKDDMIAHRSSVFEENSVIVTERHEVAKNRGLVPLGYRAIWSDRGKLCAAKLHRSIDATTPPNEYSRLLMR